jgi:hypothetical protein
MDHYHHHDKSCNCGAFIVAITFLIVLLLKH